MPEHAQGATSSPCAVVNGACRAQGTSGGGPCAPLPAVSSAPSAAPCPPPALPPAKRRSCHAARRGLSSGQCAHRVTLAMKVLTFRFVLLRVFGSWRLGGGVSGVWGAGCRVRGLWCRVCADQKRTEARASAATPAAPPTTPRVLRFADDAMFHACSNLNFTQKNRSSPQRKFQGGASGRSRICSSGLLRGGFWWRR